MRNIRNEKNSITIAFLAAGLLAFAAVKADAQGSSSDVTMPMKFAITATYQADDVSSDTSPVTKHVTKTVKWTNQSLLALMATNGNGGVAFPKGSSIEFSAGSFLVLTDKQGDTTDVSSMLSVDNSGASVYTGQDNSDTSAFNYATSQYVTVSFDDGNGNSFTLTGMAKITSSATASTDKNGNSVAKVKEAYAVSFSGAGYGSVGGNQAVFTGTASGSGSYTQSNN